MNKFVIENPALCVGCGACYSVCPVNCIEMCPDPDGFLYPKIDRNRCVNCKKCAAVCPVNFPVKQHRRDGVSCYAVENKDVIMRQGASSGGTFVAFAEHTLKKNGVVYGASMDSDFRGVSHIRVDSLKDVPKLLGSKYVQSKIGGSYQTVRKDLESGLSVVFSGTPCQIAGLKNYLGQEYDNLFTVEVICHGVPAPNVWLKYIYWIGSKIGRHISAVNFRDKENRNGGVN